MHSFCNINWPFNSCTNTILINFSYNKDFSEFNKQYMKYIAKIFNNLVNNKYFNFILKFKSNFYK